MVVAAGERVSGVEVTLAHTRTPVRRTISPASQSAPRVNPRLPERGHELGITIAPYATKRPRRPGIDVQVGGGGTGRSSVSIR
jgi:hypothetical protein